MDTIQIMTLATLAGHWQAEADSGTGSADRRAALRECADVLRGLCETRFEGLPTRGTAPLLCAECPVSPCPIGLGKQREAAPAWTRNDESTWSLLMLCGGHSVPREVVPGWTDEQCQQAEEWAGREHLHASDNDDVERVPMPSHVAAHPPKPRDSGTVDDL